MDDFNREYFGSMRAAVDEGARLTHPTVLYLLATLEKETGLNATPMTEADLYPCPAEMWHLEQGCECIDGRLLDLINQPGITARRVR